MSTHKTLLFPGARPNVGAASVALFKSKGFKVASVSRTIRNEVKAHSDLVISAEFRDPNVFTGIFEKVEKELGFPNVVVFNSKKSRLLYVAYSWSKGPDLNDPLSAPISNVQQDLNTNTISFYAAAQAAVKGFEKLPSDAKKTVIFTGNIGNTSIIPDFFLLAFTKSCTWNIVQNLAAVPLFKSKDYRFYYTDERTLEGKGMHYISGPGQANFYLELAENEVQGPILATVVRGKGYVKFESDERVSLPVKTGTQVADPMYGAPGTEEEKYGK